MIDQKLIKANAPSNNNEQTHVNHVGCPAGEDKKRRLYIKRTDKALLAFCHHCGEKGFVKLGSDDRLMAWGKTASAPAKAKEKIVLTEKLSTTGNIWLLKHGITQRDKFYGVLGKDEQVAFDLEDSNGNVVGIQVRNLLPDAKPKYITQFYLETSDVAWFNIAGCKTLVITEDYLSAYRVHKDVGFSSMALLRTSLTDKTLMQIYDLEFKYIWIWLDSDEAGMKGALKVSKTLRHFLPADVKILTISSEKEPKQCTAKELEETFL